MTVVFGVLLMVMGVAQIVLRRRTAKAAAASNRVMLNGRMSGPGFMAYSRTMAILVGSVFVVVGLLLAVGVIGGHR